MIFENEMLLRIYGERALYLLDYYQRDIWRGQRAFRCRPWRKVTRLSW